MKRFYYRVDDKIYSLPVDKLYLIPLFDICYTNNPTENISEENALDIEIKEEYIIFVLKYINIWLDKDKDKIDYAHDIIVHTCNPEQVLQSEDLKLIKGYCDFKLKKLPNKTKETIAYLKEKGYDVSCYNIGAFNELLKACTYLQIDSLINKICAYCATFIHCISHKNLFNIYQEPVLNELNEEARKEWELANRSMLYYTDECSTTDDVELNITDD